LSKCKLFWPSGDDSFIEFPPYIKRVSGLELLGFALWGNDIFFREFLTGCIDKVTGKTFSFGRPLSGTSSSTELPQQLQDYPPTSDSSIFCITTISLSI